MFCIILKIIYLQFSRKIQRGNPALSRPISPEFVLFPDFWVSNIPRYFCSAWILPDRFLYSSETEFMQPLLAAGKEQYASEFNFSDITKYIDELSSNYNNYLGQIYAVELDMKHTTESSTSACNFDLLLSIERDG